MAWIAVAASLLAPFAIDLLGGADYRDAVDLVPVLAVGFLLLAPMPVVQLTMLGEGRTGLLAWPAIAAAVINIVAVIALASRFGLMGAAVATVAGFATQLALTVALAHQLDAVPYPWSRIGGMMILTLLTASGAWLPRQLGWDLARLALTIAFPAVLVVSGAVRVAEFRALLGRKAAGECAV